MGHGNVLGSPEPKTGDPSHTRRRRSRTGCLTCRQRKKRCDEVRPTCESCTRLNLTCEYPIPGQERRNVRRKLLSQREPFSSHADVHGAVKEDKPAVVHHPNDRGFAFPLHFSHGLSPMNIGGASLLAGQMADGGQGGRVVPHPLNDNISQNIHPAEVQTSVQSLAMRRGTPFLVSPQASPLLASDPATNPSPLFDLGFGQPPTAPLVIGDELADPFAATTPILPLGPQQSPDQRQQQDQENAEPHLEPPDQLPPQPLESGPPTQALREAFPDLDNDALLLFEYFRDKQSLVLTVSPLNYFRSVFLAFSLRYRPVLYAVLAWAGWHSGASTEGEKYFVLARDLLKKEGLNSHSKEELLAALLLLASAKICSGDVNDWRSYLLWASKVIQAHGGITKFVESESVRWLLKNFAYKEVLTSSYTRVPALFSPLEFEYIFAQPSSSRLPDTLCACCEPLFIVLASINELAREVRIVDNAVLDNVFRKALALEDRIWQSRPDARLLVNLSDRDSQRQLVLFDLFQLVAILHLYQAVLHMNSAAIQVRHFNARLVNALPNVLGTSVEGILTFPLFVAGVSCADQTLRDSVFTMFDVFLSHVGAGNVQHAQHIVKEVWLRDEMGTRFVDWNELIISQGLSLSFV